MNFLRQFAIGVAEAWRQLSLSARVNIGFAAAAVVAVIGFIVVMGGQAQYVTLSDDLEPAQASKIAEALRAGGAGIGGFYTPTAAGTLIGEKHETKLIDGKKHILVPGLRAMWLSSARGKPTPRATSSTA